MVSWHIVTSADYKAGVKIDDDLYFLSDTKEIYRGEVCYTNAVEIYDTDLPASPALNRLYIEKATLAGKMWDGVKWNDIVRPVDDVVTADGKNPVSGSAVAAYVAKAIESIPLADNVIKDAEYDATEHLLTFVKGDDTTKSIVLDGLGCSLSLVDHNLQLLDASGNLIGNSIAIDSDRFIQSGEYDTVNKNIILYFDAEKTDYIVIPVGDLVDTYTVEGTASIDLQMVANKITAALKISSDAGNAAEMHEDGLYVPKTDLSGLIPKIDGGVEGNIPTIDTDGNLIDSGVSIAGIGGSHKFYVGSSIDEAATIAADAREGDYFIVEQVIAGDKVSRMAYVKKDGSWQALDGNVNSKNVYFAEDLVTTYAIGNITLTNGNATIPAAGKNLDELWKAMYLKVQNPTTTQPSVSVTAPKAAALEVGSFYTPSFTASLNAGKYTYDNSTGVTATSWQISDTAGNSANTASGSFDAITIEDNTQYRVTAVANHSDGIIPHTNTGTEYAAGQIKAGSKTGYSGYVTGFRAGFYGTVADKSGEINSALVRALAGKTTSAPAAGNTWNLQIPVGAMRIMFAYPASIRDVSKVIDVGGMNADITSAFTKYTVDVEGANGYTAVSYKVYVMDRAEAADVANKYTITL